MARNRTPQTQAKRSRERDKQAKREAKHADRLARAAARRQTKIEEADLPPEERSGMRVVELDREEERDVAAPTQKVRKVKRERDPLDPRDPRNGLVPDDAPAGDTGAKGNGPPRAPSDASD
ncbi:MAG: hypothetical protein AB7O97_04255 [Planctomycetota bacterium]